MDEPYQNNPPKHHHYVLLHIILIISIISTVVYFGYNKCPTSKDNIMASKNYDASSEIPPPLPSELPAGSVQQNKPINEKLRADSRSDAPPPLPLLT